jgi:hypothetical protein
MKYNCTRQEDLYGTGSIAPVILNLKTEGR